MIMFAAFVFAGLMDPLHIVFGLAVGAMLPRYSAWLATPALLALSVGATWAMEATPIPPEILAPMVLGRAVALIILYAIGFEVKEWFARGVR